MGHGGGRLLECENPPPVLVNAHPPLFPARRLSAPWTLARAVTVFIYLVLLYLYGFNDDWWEMTFQKSHPKFEGGKNIFIVSVL